MSSQKFAYTYLGATRHAYLETAADYPAQIVFPEPGDAPDTCRDLPSDADDYRYTHGGDQYRAACVGAWKFQREQRGA
jgi:hypothetical protein